jgi:hypothetical protein
MARIHTHLHIIQGGSNMTGTDLCVNKPHKSPSCLNHLVFNTHCFTTAKMLTRTLLNFCFISILAVKGKGKVVPLQARCGPEGSRKLRFPDYMTTAQDGGKVVSLTHRPPLPPGNGPGPHFCSRLNRPQGQSAIGRIMSKENSNDTIWNRTSDLAICSTVP